MLDMSWIGEIAADGRQTKDVQWQQIQRAENRLYSDRERKRQYAWEATAVQRRVADARAAGVHPLLALGAAVGGGPLLTMDAARGASGGGGPGGGTVDPDSRALAQQTLAESKSRENLNNAQAADIVKKLKDASDDAVVIGRANPQQDQGQPLPLYDTKNPELAEAYKALKKYERYPGEFSLVEGPGGISLHKNSYGQAQNRENIQGESSDYTVGPIIGFRDYIDTMKFNLFRYYGRPRDGHERGYYDDD